MTLEDLLKKKREILEMARRYGATNVRVFGSVARGEASRESDVDILLSLPVAGVRRRSMSLLERALSL